VRGVVIAVTSSRFVQRWRFACDGPISALALSPDGRDVAAATEDGPIVVLDPASGAQRWRTAGHSGGTTTLDWAPDSARLISGGRDGLAIVRERADGAALATVDCGAAWIERVAVAPHGRTFAVASGREVSLRGIDGELIVAWARRASTVLDLAWRPSRGASTLACVAYGAVTLFREDLARPPRELRWPGSSLVLAWSPDGRFVATGDQDSTVHFWIVKRSEDLMMSGYARKVRELAWSADAKYLATGGGTDITVWNCTPPGPAGSEPIVLEEHEAPVRSLAFRHDGPTLASCAADGSLVVWNVTTGNAVATLDGSGVAANAVRWSREDDTLFVADAAGIVTAWSQAG
jgi:WD40 repeat protein